MGKPKLLIVEDETAILRALSKVFQREGFDVMAAPDGLRGLAEALEKKPDLILLDIMMPGIDGLEMLRRIREEGGEWGKTVKTIVYTNLSYNEKREEARNLGVTDFVIKADVGLAEVMWMVKAELGLPALDD